MKARYKVFVIVAIIIVILIITISLIRNKQGVINTNMDDITSITITERQGKTFYISDKNVIKEIVNYLTSKELKQNKWSFTKPDNWNFRIGIYNDKLSIMKESLYVTSDGIVYKSNINYTLSEFDYDYFLSLIKEQ